MAQVIPIALASDVHMARRAARAMALAIGFDAKVSEEIVIAVSELASNLVKHARGGKLTLTPVNNGGRVGMQVEAGDHGPGIADVEQAMADGFSTAGSLGCGLGTVNRLMDQFDITSQRGAGARTTIVCTRWRRVDEPALTPCPLQFGIATRPYPTMPVNGDAFVIKRWSASALVAVIDGLGHGPYAHRAAQTARQYVETHVDQPLEAIFRGVGRACRATRGVVMALVRFDFGGNGIRFAFASVGNVEARVFGGRDRQPFIVRRGIVGGNAPNPRVTEHRWEPGTVMVLHSDGVTRHWGLADFPDLASESATTMAQRLLRALAKEQDDATVVVVRGMARAR
jgi:anti-sigma regulatory factor (Ser/Thr protein kinase)